MTFTRDEQKCRYLTDRVTPNIDSTGIVLTEDFAAVLKELNSIKSVKAVLLANTSTNTGCEAGSVTSLEKKKVAHVFPLSK